MRPLRLHAIALSLLVACGGSSDREDDALQEGWNPVSGMVCADGSATGIGVSLGTQNRVLVVLSGGGACWDAASCPSDVLRAFGPGEFAIARAVLPQGSILNPSLPGNPFSGWTLVFVPYCTGDVHAGGDVTKTYGARGTWRHHGRANLEAALSRVASAIPNPEKVVVSGFSAGGFGSLLAFDIARARWPAGPSGPRAYLVDDSGPTLVGNDLPQALREAWWTSWNLDATVTPLCPGCRADLSALWTALRERHPADRLALLSSTQDATMRGFFGGMAAADFQAGVANLAAKLSGIAGAASFRVNGTAHVLLFSPGTYVAGSTTLTAWLAQQVNDDPAWTSAGP